MSWTLPCDVLCVGLANDGSNISRSLKLLCLMRNIENLSAIHEKSGYLLRQRGNARLVGNPEVIQRDLFQHLPETVTLDFRPVPISRSSGPWRAAPGFNFRMARYSGTIAKMASLNASPVSRSRLTLLLLTVRVVKSRLSSPLESPTADVLNRTVFHQY